MSTLIIGANGKIGRLLIARLVAAGETPLCMIRDAAQADEIKALGGEPIVGDLEGDFDEAYERADAVVFAAGSGGQTGGDKTIMVDLWGAIKTIDFCRKFGIDRYLMVSALRADDPDNGPESIRHYLVAKHLADEYLQRSNLDWTILRPGRLTDEPGTGQVALQREPDGPITIPRDDVAAALQLCLARPAETARQVIDLISGPTPIADALATLPPPALDELTFDFGS